MGRGAGPHSATSGRVTASTCTPSSWSSDVPAGARAFWVSELLS